MKPSAGTGMRMHKVFVRFAPKNTPGRRAGISACDDHLVEIRKLLRTDMSLVEIADHFHIETQSLRRFIKRRNICDMRARRDFNTLQRSLAREDKRQHSSDGEQPLCRRKRADSSPAAGTIHVAEESV